MGFKVFVMRHAFVVHKGFKSKTGFHASKKAEHTKNRALFGSFLSGLKKKYGT